MGKFRIEIKELAKKQIIQHYKSGDKKSIKNIEKILLELSETPFEGIGKPELLKCELSGSWSRRINEEHRIIYEIHDDGLIIILEIQSLKGHYNK